MRHALGEAAVAASLLRLVEAVQNAQSLESVLDLVVHLAPELLGRTQCAVFLVDPADGRLVPSASSGLGGVALTAFQGLVHLPVMDIVQRAVDTREPVVAQAGTEDFGIPAAVADTFGVRAMLVTALVSRGRLLGVLVLHTPGDARPFTDAEVALGHAVASHAAVAIDTTRLARQTQLRLHETSARLAVSDALGSTLDVTETMRRVAREIGCALGADMVGAYLADAAHVALRPIAGYHVPRPLIPSFLEFALPIANAPGHEALWRGGRSFWTANAAADDRLDPEMVRRFPHRSNLVVPMIVKGAPIGVFVLIWWHVARIVSAEEIALVEGISDQSAMFIANARLYEALQERLARERETRERLERSERRHTVFGEIVKEIAAETELDALFALIGRRMCELIEADAAAISLVDGDDIVLRGQWGLPDGAEVTIRRPIAESRVGRVIAQRRPFVSADMAADPHWCDSTVVQRLGYRAVLEAPIILRGEVIGVVGALQRAPRVFSDEDLRLMVAIAEHSALAVDRTTLHAQRGRRLRETEQLLEVSQAVTSTLDVAEIARRTVREMTRALGADCGGAWMLAPDGEALIPLAGYRVPAGLLDGPVTLPPDHPLVVAGRRLEMPVAFPDSQAEPLLDHPLVQRLHHRSFLLCPMRLGGDTVGGFAIVWVQHAHVFTAGEMRLVEGMARQAAVAVENARLLAAEREARAHLALSEGRYRELLENVIDVVYVHDLQGVIREINGAGVRLSGYTRDELIGMSVSRLLAPDDVARAGRLVQRMLEGSVDVGLFTAEFVRKDGSRRMMECSGRVLSRDGAPLAVQGVARDITERRQLEQRQAVLVALSRELASEVNLDALLSRIAVRVRALLGVDACLLLMVQGEDLVFRGADGMEAELVAAGPRPVASSLIGAVVRDRHPVVCRDLAADPQWATLPFVHRFGYRGLLAVPLAVQDRILGVLEVLQREPRAFTADEIDFLEALATQAALAIDNARLLEETQSRLRETETLLALGETVIPALDVSERMRLLARETSRAFGADMVGAYLADAEGARLSPIAGYHVPPDLLDEFMRYPIPLVGQSDLEEAWRTGLPVATRNMGADPHVLDEVRRHFPCQAVVFAPIVAGERPVGGFFLVWWHDARVLTSEELRLLAGICRHGALFLYNSRLYAEATQRRREAEELARLARGLTENLDVGEVGRRTAQSALLLLGGIFATLRSLRRDGTLGLVASSGDTWWLVEDTISVTSGAGVVARAALTGAPVWSSNILTEAGVEYSDDMRRCLLEHGSIALLAVPLQVSGQLKGVLSIADRAGRVFRDSEIALLKAFADQAAIALENGRLYGELREALDTVEESQQHVVRGERLRALGELAGGVAHDFNNVLAIIAGRTEVLMADTSDPALRRHLDVIMKVTFDASQTVRRIQEFTRKRRARPFESLDLNVVVDEVVEVTRSRWRNDAQARGVRYEVTVEHGELPLIAGEPAEIREALTNVIFNALDAMPTGGAVRLRTGVEGGRVFCAVADTGVGMPEPVRQRVFDPFFTTKGERGTGLGLSVVYGIMSRHGGDIDVQSRAGEGAVFTLRFPVAAPAPSAAPEPLAASTPRGGHVLVVDDEKEVREILTDLLRRDGHTMVVCEDGEGAMARLEAERFDLVITDLGMPGLSGWDVASAVRLRQPGTPVAMVTGWGDQIDPSTMREQGVDYLVSKPFRRNDIRTMLAAVLGRRRA